MIFYKVRIFARFPSLKKKTAFHFSSGFSSCVQVRVSIHCHPQPWSTSSPKARSNLLLFCSSLLEKNTFLVGGWSDRLVKNICSSNWIISPNKGEIFLIKKMKPPPVRWGTPLGRVSKLFPTAGVMVGGGFWPILSIHLGCVAHTLVHSWVHG